MPLDLIGDSTEAFYEFADASCPAKAGNGDEDQGKDGDEEQDSSRKRREDDEDGVNDDEDDVNDNEDDISNYDDEDGAPAEPVSIGDVLDASFEEWLKTEKVRMSIFKITEE